MKSAWLYISLDIVNIILILNSSDTVVMFQSSGDLNSKYKVCIVIIQYFQDKELDLKLFMKSLYFHYIE